MRGGEGCLGGAFETSSSVVGFTRIEYPNILWCALLLMWSSHAMSLFTDTLCVRAHAWFSSRYHSLVGLGWFRGSLISILPCWFRLVHTLLLV